MNGSADNRLSFPERSTSTSIAIQSVVNWEGLTGDAVQKIVDRHRAQVNELEQSDAVAVMSQYQFRQKLLLSGIQSQQVALLGRFCSIKD
ncbi:hypothetical protein [Spirosoma linguale]|uniref:Uncharacterized protein n=1 Tax=Spirosoma linguale (strain ATCC 33905 / DSM 74 / LMG 10896 / Claus 1) TaxID=504472 RepID=D2QN78_SPILD|nr:hypothetical protein Slin_3256 [Spirosoma linguale DSM 74]